MPRYRVTDPTTGQSLTLTGDSPPTEAELEQIFARTGGTSETAPTFRSTNAKDANGDAVVGDRLMSTLRSLRAFGGEATQGINPINILKGVQAAALHPIQTGRALLSAQDRVRQQAVEAYRRGDTMTALAKGAEWLVPFLGPRLSEAGDLLQSGDVARGLGASVDVGLQVAAPLALKRMAPVKTRPIAPARNARVADAVEYGQREGIPLDAGTATDRPMVKILQKRATNSMGGAGTAERFQAAQSAKLAETGKRLAERAAPGPSMTPETAGQSVRDAVQARLRDARGAQSKAYQRLERIEADPAQSMDVPKPLTPEQAAVQRAVDSRAKVSAGRVPTAAEWVELRRIREELDAVRYQPGGRVNKAGVDGNAELADIKFVRRSANAKVYHDILQNAPGTSDITGNSMVVSIDQALKTGSFSNAAKGALEVARKRIAGHKDVASALFERPGTMPAPELAPMRMPVDLTKAKDALRPVYSKLTRQLPVTQQRSSPGLKAIENILNGPDYAPVTQVDADLSAIKQLARGGDIPEMRDISQGVAAQAVKALHSAVDEAVQFGGPDAIKALAEGRQATRAKYAAADVLKGIRKEPVQAYKQTTFANDAGIAKLREVAKLAPKELPKVGRAYLEDLMATATAEGGFSRAQGLHAKWQALGPETKRALFKDPALVQDIDRFMLLAKKIGENPNPSGTAGVLTALNAASAPATYALSKLFYSRRGVALLTKGIQIPVGNKAAVAAWVSDVTRALGEAPGRALVPAAAGEGTPESRRR